MSNKEINKNDIGKKVEKQVKKRIKREKQQSKKLQKYLEEIKKKPSLNVEREKELIERIKKGDSKAKKELVSANLRLVVSIAKEKAKMYPGFNLSDLIQEGNLGLLKAIEKFDLNKLKDYRFSSYAEWWIRMAITRFISEEVRVKNKKKEKERILKETKVKTREGQQSKELKKYLEKVKNTPFPTYEEEKGMWKRIGEGDASAKEEIFKGYLKVVVKITKSFIETTGRDYPYLTPLEIIREGEKGLMKAIERCAPKSKEDIGFLPYIFRQLDVESWIWDEIRKAFYKKAGFQPGVITDTEEMIPYFLRSREK